MKLLEHLKWRYATKKYDAAKKVDAADIRNIKEAIQLSASSFGLQLFTVLDVVSPEIRAQLKAASWDQPQITDASHLFVFCNYSDVKDEHIDEYLALKATTQNIDANNLKGYGDFMKNSIKGLPEVEKQIWTAKQTYIALSTGLAACAELKIDSTPMEGFDKASYDKILNLKDKGLQSSVVLAIGYRSEEDTTQHESKVRKSVDTLFETYT